MDSGSRFIHVNFHDVSDGTAAGVHGAELFAAMCRLDVDGISFHRGKSKSRLGGYISVLVRSIIQSRRRDFLYIRLHPIALPLMLLARWRRQRTVVEVNGTVDDLVDSYPWTRLFRRVVSRIDTTLLRRADGIVVVSAGMREWAHIRAPNVSIAVIPNAADPQRFHPMVQKPTGLPRRYVAYCGALAPWQGIETLAAAVAHPAWPADVGLVVAGEGPLRSLLLGQRGETEIVDLGTLPHSDVPGVVAGALAVVSSRTQRDASPMKLYEALACGVPVVAADIPGQGETVRREGVGLTYPPHDPQALASAVAALARDSDLRRRLAAAASAASRDNTWDSRAVDLLNFMSRLAQNAQSAALR